MTQWVNVKDRLPSKTGRYITFSWDNKFMHRTFMLLGYRNSEKEFCEKDCEFDVHYWLEEDFPIERLLSDKIAEERAKHES